MVPSLKTLASLGVGVANSGLSLIESDPCQHIAVWPLEERATYRNHGLPACTRSAFSHGTLQQTSNSYSLFSSKLMYHCFLPLCASCLTRGCGWRYSALPSAVQPWEKPSQPTSDVLGRGPESCWWGRMAPPKDVRKTGLETCSNIQNSNQNLYSKKYFQQFLRS